MMPTLRNLLLAAVLAVAMGHAVAHDVAPQNVVSLSASASIEVPQDQVAISLSTQRDGPDASAVQAQLRGALEAALASARERAAPGDMEVRTGQFSLFPRYGRDGKLNGWQGSVELVLQGRDLARISATAGQLQTLTVSGVNFSLSRDARARSEADAQSRAIEQFRQRADAVARSFGFTGYTLREINVSADQSAGAPRMRAMAAEARTMAADAPVPIEAGRTSVTVTVSGSVQLTR